jgi:hypothetical protein
MGVGPDSDVTSGHQSGANRHQCREGHVQQWTVRSASPIAKDMVANTGANEAASNTVFRHSLFGARQLTPYPAVQATCRR